MINKSSREISCDLNFTLTISTNHHLSIMDNTERETIASGETPSLQQDLSSLLLQATKDANKELIKHLLSQGADFSARGEKVSEDSGP